MKHDNNPSKISDKRYFIDLVYQNARAGLRAEVSRGFLGMLWWVIEPVVYMGVFYIVFAHIYQRGDENFIVFLLTGLISWKWFQATINTGANSLIAGAGLMNQVYLPKIIFPLTNITVNTFKFLIILVLFLIFLQFTAVKPSWNWFLLPALVLTQLSLITAITCFLAAVMPFFPDLRVILNNILMMIFFLSGIFYDIGRLPESYKHYLLLNPLATLISMYRKLFLYGLPPEWFQLLMILLFSLSLLILAIALFQRYDRVYPKIVY
jgi:lipopolysaccharide transport system permease protein